ncbi:hypothetical protein J5TS2_01380 [Brevibacillus halotolerans]|nr:hypothetical protein [Brevibacillus halotolerans]GIN99469.1 hypothetical protein J5TS2_01380 [Brevibacillus halotolerans]
MKKTKIHVDTGLQVNWTFGTKVEDKPDTQLHGMKGFLRFVKQINIFYQK